MPTSLRLNGDRDRAAMWWGEAKRVLFQLKENLGYLGIDHGWRTRKCADGSIIKVGTIYGANIIMIDSPFIVEKVGLLREPVLYILCLRNVDLDLPNSFRVYSIGSDGGAIVTKETEKKPTEETFHLEDWDTGTALGIISKPTREGNYLIRKKHVVSWGLDYEDWLFTYRVAGFYWTENITYEDRYLYTHPYPDPDYGTIFQVGYRMVNAFKRIGGRSSYYSTPAYFPKLVLGNVEWTTVEHDSYAAGADVVGKNNITLDAEKRYAESWGERICEQESAPYSFNLDGITNPFQDIDIPHINWFGRYTWPIIGTLNARKVPKVYSKKYEADDGTHTTEDFWTETLEYNETGGNGTGSGVTYWPIVAIGNKQFLYLKNTLTQDTTYSNITIPGPAWPDWTGTVTTDLTHDEELIQEFYAGTVLIESLISTIARVYDYDYNVTPTGGYAIGTTYKTIAETFQATYRWVEVLDYSNLDGNLIVFYKKITEEIDWPYAYSNSGAYSPGSGSPPSPPRVVTSSRIGTSTRKVEYYLATIIDGVLTKRLLKTFDGTCDTEASFVGTDSSPAMTGETTGVWTRSSEEDGIGERIYGVSCQMNKEYAVFSFNKETFDGTGANSTDYFKAKISAKKVYNWFGVGLANTVYLPYPSPLEDMNTIIETETPAWSVGNFCVGALGLSKKTGQFGYSEFDNQIDVVAATGLLDLLRRVE